MYLLYLICIFPMTVLASDGDYQDIYYSPWDKALYAILQLMTGPIATTVGAIALVATGYLFLKGRIDVMRLFAIVAGLALIFGAPHLVSLIKQEAF